MAGNPTAIWTDLVNQTQAIIQAMGLVYGTAGTSLPNGQVYQFKFPTDLYRMPKQTGGIEVLFPCIQVCPYGREVLEKGDFEDTQIIYPVLVIHAFASNHTLGLNNDEFYWRQKIIDKFIDQPRPEVVTCQDIDCQIDPEPVIDMSLFTKENLDVGGLLLKFNTWVSRGR